MAKILTTNMTAPLIIVMGTMREALKICKGKKVQGEKLIVMTCYEYVRVRGDELTAPAK